MIVMRKIDENQREIVAALRQLGYLLGLLSLLRVVVYKPLAGRTRLHIPVFNKFLV
jgi:hypothetical protein